MSIREVRKHLADAQRDIQDTPAKEASEQWAGMKLQRATQIVDELIDIFDGIKDKLPTAVRLTRKVIEKTESSKNSILASMEGDDHIDEADLVKNALAIALFAGEESEKLPIMQSRVSQGANGLLEVFNGVTDLHSYGETVTEVLKEIADLQPVILQEITAYRQRLDS